MSRGEGAEEDGDSVLFRLRIMMRKHMTRKRKERVETKEKREREKTLVFVFVLIKTIYSRYYKWLVCILYASIL